MLTLYNCRPNSFDSSTDFHFLSCSKPSATVPRDQKQLILPSTLYFTAFLKVSSKVLISVYLFAFFYFHSVIRWNSKIHFIIIIIIVFSHQRYLIVFHWSLSDSKSPQVSGTLFCILAVLNNVVVWMASTRIPTSKSSSPFSNPLVTVRNAPITIGIIVTCIFHIFITSNLGGARGVMVIVVGNGHGDTRTNPGRDWLHFT